MANVLLPGARGPLDRGLSRRRFMQLAAAAGTLTIADLLAGTPSAKALQRGDLKGTKLTVIAGPWYVPENNTQLDNLAAQMTSETGMDVKVEWFAGEQQVAKVAAIVESGSGGDVAVVRDFDAYLYADKLRDVTDIAMEVEQNYGGWYDVAKQACIVNGVWKSLMIGQAPAAWNWRPDMFAAAGVDKFPDTFDGLLDAARKLSAKGTPIGMTLGHASGDARSTNYPVLWAFGGKEFEADGKTVAINSPETLKAVEWYQEAFKNMDPGVVAWLDPDNNQAFASELVSATVNVNTIYLSSRNDKDPAKNRVAQVMDHANWPSGPAGRYGHYNINLWAAFGSSPNPEGQMAFLRAWHARQFLLPWAKTGEMYFIPPLKGLEDENIWPTDPKLQIFRELNKINRLAGFSGPPTRSAAEAVNKFLLVDMFAQACTGVMSASEAVKWAENEYKQIVAKG